MVMMECPALGMELKGGRVREDQQLVSETQTYLEEQ